MEYPIYYKKAIKGSVGGRTLDKKGDMVEFLLKGDPMSDDEDVIVEINDADAEKFFEKTNKTAIAQGYIIRIDEHTLTLDESNAVSDGYLKDLLKQPFMQMKKRVEEFTSPIPVNRLLEFASQENKPVKTVEYIKSAISKLEGGDAKHIGINDGAIKVQSV